MFLSIPALFLAQKTDSLAATLQVDSLINRCRALSGKSQFKEAILVIETGEKIALEYLGRNSSGYARCIFNHGKVLHTWGKMDEAEPFYLEAKEIQEKVLGKEHPDYATSLFQLASLTKDKGDYDEAELLYLESIKIRAKVPGKEHPDYAWSINYLANLYRATGDYDKAEPLLIESMEIRAKVPGKEHPDYAWSLNSLGNLYTDKGDYAKAEPLYLESMRIREKALGKDHPNFSASLNNLGLLYVRTGQYSKAEPLYLEAKERRERILGKMHPAYAVTLNNLAELYFFQAEYSKVESLYLEAKDIQAKVFGKEHPDYALSLDNLANLYKATKAYVKAEPYYLEAKDIREKVFGKTHPDYAMSLNNLAIFYTETGNYAKSKYLYLESIQTAWHLINKSAEYSSEIQQNAYLHTFEGTFNRFYAFAQTHPDTALLRAAYDNVILMNGYLLENSRQLLRSYDAADSLTRATYENWQSARRRLAKRYARPIEERKKIAEAEAEAEGYEKMLLRRLPNFLETRKTPSWLDIRNRLKPEDAAVEFVRYHCKNPDGPDSIRYAALMLRPEWDAPKLIPLFEENEINSLLKTSVERKMEYVAQLYSIDDRGIIISENPKKSLYDLIWKPLEKELNTPNATNERVKTIYFTPTGLLHRLNLGAIPLNIDSTLADRYWLIGLGSTRQLVAQIETTPNKKALLFGGIQFEMDSAAIFAANARLNQTDLTSRGADPDFLENPNLRGGSWNYLKGAEKEVNAISKILTEGGLLPETRKGFDATEEAFKSIGTKGPSPRILHLATHGFFFPDPKDTTQQKGVPDSRETGFKTSDNPLIRSGLLLAGANHAWKNGKPFKKGMENGILTAYEISHMNLSNTELVVLSACETGLGDIEGNEGVYGLQRAFKIAGAKYLIMSLWQVPDRETAEFMTTFYKKWLTDNMTIPESFQETQKEMRERFMNPYSWAGFVLVE